MMPMNASPNNRRSKGDDLTLSFAIIVLYKWIEVKPLAGWWL